MSDESRIKPPWTRSQWLKNTVIWLIIRAWLPVLVRIPRSVLPLLGRSLGAAAFVLFPAARRTARLNLSIAYDCKQTSGKRPTAWQVYQRLGCLLMDTILLLRPKEKASATLPLTVEAKQLLDEQLQKNKGLVLITAHLGSWERLACVLVEHGYTLTVPVRKSYDQRLERDVIARLRENRGVKALDRQASTVTKQLLRALRNNECVGFLTDVRTSVASVYAPFFGQQAKTPSGAARIALRTGAPIVAIFAFQSGIQAWLVRKESTPTQGAIDFELQDLVSEINQHLEKAICTEPQSWIWMHNRFADETKMKHAVDALPKPKVS